VQRNRTKGIATMNNDSHIKAYRAELLRRFRETGNAYKES